MSLDDSKIIHKINTNKPGKPDKDIRHHGSSWATMVADLLM